jgi:hypothetical protein
LVPIDELSCCYPTPHYECPQRLFQPNGTLSGVEVYVGVVDAIWKSEENADEAVSLI